MYPDIQICSHTASLRHDAQCHCCICISSSEIAYLQVMILFGSAYELCMWLYYSDSQQWVYVALDWERDKSVLIYVFLPVVYTVLFFVW